MHSLQNGARTPAGAGQLGAQHGVDENECVVARDRLGKSILWRVEDVEAVRGVLREQMHNMFMVTRGLQCHGK